LRHRTDPIQIDIRFALGAIDARVRTINYRLPSLRGESGGSTELVEIGDVDLAGAYDGNRLAGAIDALRKERTQVIYIRDVSRREHVRSWVGIGRVELRGISFRVMAGGLNAKIVESAEAEDERSQGGGDGWIGGDGEVRFAVHIVLVQCGVKGLFDLGRRSAEDDPVPPACNVFDREPL